MQENQAELHTPGYRRSIAAICLAPIYYWVLPVALRLFGADSDTANYVFFTIGILWTCVLFLSFLRSSFPLLLAKPPRLMRALAAGAGIHYGAALAVSLALVLSGIHPQSANNETIRALIRSQPALMFLFSVVAVPITEECLFRGALFGTLRKKNRAAAYLVTMTAFALVHAAPGLVAGRWEDAYTALLYFAPSAALCFVYEYVGTIWASVLLHMLINLVSFANALLMR